MKIIENVPCDSGFMLYRGDNCSSKTTAVQWEVKILYLDGVIDPYGPDLILCTKGVVSCTLIEVVMVLGRYARLMMVRYLVTL